MHLDRAASPAGVGKRPGHKWWCRPDAPSAVLSRVLVHSEVVPVVAEVVRAATSPSAQARRVDAEPRPDEMSVEESVIWCAYAAMAR